MRVSPGFPILTSLEGRESGYFLGNDGDSIKGVCDPNVDSWHYIRERSRREKEAALRQKLGDVAIKAYKKGREDDSRYRSDGSRGRDPQHVDDDIKVEVTNGYSRDYDCYTTDFILAPRDGTGDRLHIVFDDKGNELLHEWHHKKSLRKLRFESPLQRISGGVKITLFGNKQNVQR